MAHTHPTNHRSANFSTAMRNSAAKRQCPGCGRKSATSRVDDGFYRWTQCRWCGWHTEPKEM